MSSPYPSELRKVAEKEKPFMEKLNSDNLELQWEAVIDIRNAIVGNRRQKANFIVMGIIHKLNAIISQSNSPDKLKRDSITLLTSLSKGTNNNIIALCDYGAYQTLIDVLISTQSSSLLLATLRCILSILSSTSFEKQTDHRSIQTKTITISKFQNEKVLARLVEVLDYDSQEITISSLAILNKLSYLSKPNLLSQGPVASSFLAKLTKFLQCKQTSKDITLLSIQLLISWIENGESDFLFSHSCLEIDKQIISYLIEIDRMPLSQFQEDLQIAICQCLVLLLDKISLEQKSVLLILRRLSQLCSSKNPEIRIAAAMSLADLISRDITLQNIAFYSNQLPKKIEKFFQLPQGTDGDSITRVKKFTRELNAYSRLRCAGLTLLGALTQDDERLRTVILAQKGPSLMLREPDSFVSSWAMNALVEGITEQQDPNDPGARMVLLASLRCLQSFSRSNQHLRTTLYDSEIYEHFGRLFEQHKSDDEVFVKLLPNLANFLLDFCPQKSDLVELTLGDITDCLLKKDNLEFKSHCLACLINMSHQSGSSLRYKNDIIQKVTLREFHELMEKCNNPIISNQILILLRNLVDENNLLLESKGDEIIKICHYWLREYKSRSENSLLTSVAVVLRNISSLPDGVTRLFGNEELIKNIVLLLSDQELAVKTQSSYIISNLLRHTDDTFTSRQKTLRSAGLLNVIQDNPPASKYNKLNENVENILKRLGELN